MSIQVKFNVPIEQAKSMQEKKKRFLSEEGRKTLKRVSAVVSKCTVT